MKVFFAWIGALAFLLLVVACIVTLNYGLGAFFAPRWEAVRRDQMLNSRAYDEGTKRELYRLKLQYAQARSDVERDTIAAAARHEFQIFPRNQLPPDLQEFMAQVGG